MHKPVVEGAGLEHIEGAVRGFSVARHNGLGVDVHVGQLLSLAQQLGCENNDTGGAVADLVILHLGELCSDINMALQHVNVTNQRGPWRRDCPRQCCGEWWLRRW